VTEENEIRVATRRAFVLGATAAAAASACAPDHPAASRSAGSTATVPPRGRSTNGQSTTSEHPTTSDGAASSIAAFVSTGPTTRPEVALTFHTSGDVGLAHQLLDILDARGVRITAFIVGAWLQKNPDWAKRLVDAGHELANHTQHHLVFEDLPSARKETEIVECRDLLRSLAGTGGTYFRPSGTVDGVTRPSDGTLTAAAQAGYATVLGYDVDPADYRDPGAAAVLARVLGGVHPGAIVSMHFGHAGTIAAMPHILDGLDQRGLKPVTSSDLLA
jgi:peptidoglycan/xylan/chitin deacetylase (PgdA/CDA1 family)